MGPNGVLKIYMVPRPLWGGVFFGSFGTPVHGI